MPRITAEAAVHICAGQDEFVDHANRWKPGSPFPLLPGPALDRYRSLLGGDGLPEVTVQRRKGVVVSTGGAFGRAAARLLATATGREHLHIPRERLMIELERFAGRPVAVVGPADEVYAVDDWPGVTGAWVGVVTARTPQALACLLYRSLTVEAAGEDRVFVASHPLLQGAADADAVELSELNQVRERRVKLLTLRGRGRECSVGMLDAVICGRDDPPTSESVEVEPGQRRTSCLRGEGCFRRDLPEEARVPAAELNATVVFTHSCRSLEVGTHVFPTRIHVGLGLLDGTAVAVIGAQGMHFEQGSVQWTLEEALSERIPLGEVVHRITAGSYPFRGEMTRFGLLGDPGLVLPWSERTTGVQRVRPRVDEEAVATLRGLRETVARLERLRWLGDRPVPDGELLPVEARIHSIASDLLNPEMGKLADEVADDLADLQHRAVDRMIDHIYSNGWDFIGRAHSGLRELTTRPETCPQCERPTAVQILMRHRIDESLFIQTLQCRRCGDNWWTTEPIGPTVMLRGPMDFRVVRNQPTPIARDVVNTGAALVRGAVGFAFPRRRTLGLPPGQSAACTVEPGGSQRVPFVIDTTGGDPTPEMHTTVFVGLLGGLYVCSIGMMRLE